MIPMVRPTLILAGVVALVAAPVREHRATPGPGTLSPLEQVAAGIADPAQTSAVRVPGLSFDRQRAFTTRTVDEQNLARQRR